MKKSFIAKIKVRQAKFSDCVVMQEIINHHADQGLMLHRSLFYLATNLCNYFVAELEGKIIGTCGFKIWPDDGIEIISSAVIEEHHRKGVGQKMIRRVIRKGKFLGFKKFFSLTLQAGFFQKIGFQVIGKDELSHKVYTECANCPKNKSFDPKNIKCDEDAVMLVID